MPQQDDEATELEHAEKVGFMIFPAAHQTAEVVKPSKKAFDFPTAAITTQFATILGIFPTAIVLMGRNESDAVGGGAGLAGRSHRRGRQSFVLVWPA